MRKYPITIIILLTLVATMLLGLVLYYSENIAILNPKGLIALKQRDLMLISTVLMLIVVIPVFIMTAAIAWEYRSSNKAAKYTPNWDHNLTAEFIWWGFPFIIILILSVVTWQSSHELDPYKPLESSTKPLVIQAVALQWKWLFIYPEQKIATINFIQIPEKTPINFKITADSPMNSLWIPELAGQIYAMPGMETHLHLIADDLGDYRGSSANISGEGFSGMTFTVRSSTHKDFDEWIKSVQSSTSGHSLDIKEYQKIAKPSSYDPVAYFSLGYENLFDWIATKPMRVSTNPREQKKELIDSQSHKLEKK